MQSVTFLKLTSRTVYRFAHCLSENAHHLDSVAKAVAVSPALVDSFSRKHTYLRISVTERCSFRCQYCMPEEGVQLTPSSDLLTTKEIIQISELFIKLGVNKIRLTGGEPLIRRDIVELIGALSEFKQLHTIALTTNGLILHRKLKDLKGAGLNALNISLDTFISQKFEFLTRRKGLTHVLRSIEDALEMGFRPVKVNCVVMRGINDDEIGSFVEYTKNKDVDVRFIEFCPFTGNKWNSNKMISYSEILDKIKLQYPDVVRIADLPNDTSKAYKVPGYMGQIGFITSMTENFCGSCNRLRITADGNLKVCLFGKEEVSLRDAVRQNATEEELIGIISSTVLSKKKQHAGLPTHRPSSIFAFQKISSSAHGNAHFLNQRYQVKSIANHRYFSTKLTHVNENGEIKMVDVNSKPKTVRIAEAQACIYLGPTAFQLVKENKMEKGDVLSVANIAGIMAAKRTSDLIPLCHSISIDHVKLDFTLLSESYEICIRSTVKITDRTGAEMEALTAATIAALTVYDMCKAVSKDMVIKSVKLVLKTGGKQDYRLQN